MLMETIVFISKAKCFMPFHSCLFPFLEPVEFRSRSHKKLHFHLFKFTHSENKLSCNNFVTKSFPNLCNSERDFHASGFLHVKVVHKNSLGSFWTKVNFRSSFCGCSYFCCKHQVKLSNICPVSRT